MSFPGILHGRWYCPCCETPHRSEPDAYECCNGIAVFGFGCPKCGSVHEDEDAALLCCGWTATTEGARALARAAEEAGQLPLEL